MRATRPITASLAAVVAAGALAGPAGAMPIDPTKPEPTPDPTARPLASTPPHKGHAPHSTFDWGSGGIGAAAGVGAFAIVLAGTAGMRRRQLPDRRSLVTH